MLDVVVRPVTPVAPTSDTPARVRVGRGGSAANLAVALRAAVSGSIEVCFVGVVGDDTAARLVRDDLEGAGVVAHLRALAGATGVVVALVGERGERAMLTERGVNGQLRYEDVEASMDDSLVHLHVSGYTILDPGTREMVPRLLTLAHSLGATTSIDVCSAGPLRVVGPAVFQSVASGSTMLFANEEEAVLLSGEGDVAGALGRLSQDWSEVVVTRGARGAMAVSGGEIVTVPARVEHVVDTTGAGDSATGTYLAHRLRGADVTTSLARAMEAAAHVVGGLGSRG